MTSIKKILISSLMLSIVGCSTFLSNHIYHVVERGNTLYSIAWQHETTFEQIAKANKIKPPYFLREGEVLKIPLPSIIVNGRQTRKKNRSTPRKVVRVKKNRATVVGKGVSAPSGGKKSVASASKSKSVTSKTPIPTTVVSSWSWPTDGKVVKSFGSDNGLIKGLMIKNKQHQAIKSSAEGVVVYSGSGLRSYGNLIIVKHNTKYLSAYGHLQTMKVKEGQSVKRGQVIGTQGLSKNLEALLHFEIRANGRPVDPIRYLSSR